MLMLLLVVLWRRLLVLLMLLLLVVGQLDPVSPEWTADSADQREQVAMVS